MTEKQLTELVKAIGEAMGFIDGENGFFRANYNGTNGTRFFGFISKGDGNIEDTSATDSENDESGAYNGLSLVFFPKVDGVSNKGDKKDGSGDVESFIISLGVGTLGLGSDYELATRPGTRRLFLRLRDENQKENQFFKNDFTDITKDLVNNLKNGFPVADRYGKLLQSGQFIEFEGRELLEKKESSKIDYQIDNLPKDIEGYIKTYKPSEKETNSIVNIICRWIAAYAVMRKNVWKSYKKGKTEFKDSVENSLPKPQKEELSTDDLCKILEKNRFVVLQGAPGTGKTWSANEVAKNFDEVLFEQFHAETTYSDFIYGIRPKLGGTTLLYEENKGVLLRAIETAKEYKEKKVLLIIDEINRANLSNVLGPVFYLFEKGASDRTHKIKIGGDHKIEKLPDNLFVIATMNTADRSLAVVDFALRRRFTWLTLKPHVIEEKALEGKGKIFMDTYFNEMAAIFEEYATDEELNLQPGQSYFIVNNSNQDEEMKERLRYELMPLIKEYLNEGYLASAKEVFCNYFYQTIGELMYE